MPERKIVGLDPGHPSWTKSGEINWGAASPNGQIKEVEINLEVALLLKKIWKV